MTQKEKLRQFIEDNNLTFEHGRRNADSVILSGYALHLKYTNASSIRRDVKDMVQGINTYRDFDTTFKYAKRNKYGNYWETEDAKKKYKF